MTISIMTFEVKAPEMEKQNLLVPLQLHICREDQYCKEFKGMLHHSKNSCSSNLSLYIYSRKTKSDTFIHVPIKDRPHGRTEIYFC